MITCFNVFLSCFVMYVGRGISRMKVDDMYIKLYVDFKIFIDEGKTALTNVN